LPTHLLLPLLASMLFVVGLIFFKRTSGAGVSPWTATFIANQWAAALFSSLWLLGGTEQPWSMLWQPAIIAVLYVLGQIFTFSAIEHGDVSVATPVFGTKVVLVAGLLALVGGTSLPVSVWLAAALATAGIALVQWTGYRQEVSPYDASKPSRITLTIGLALGAATSFAMFDVLLQAWAPAWGTGRILPIVFWITSFLSVGFLPWFQRDKLMDRAVRPLLLLGTLLIALQALCLVFTLAQFGDAARVNVVYAMRGMWGVIFAWAIAKKWGGREAHLTRSTLGARLVGATMLTLAVVLAIAADSAGY
jgi:drug/metabolite transporter (DMT)-like permease